MDGLLKILPGTEKSEEWPWLKETDPSVYDSKMAWPKITIVTPSLNQGELIEETIRSILLQNYPNLEYIIVDGGSTDNTLNVIKKYEKWITRYISEPDHGQSDAINKGLKMATGSIFNWINSDDLLAPGALEVVGKSFITSGGDVLCGYTRIFNHYSEQDERIVRMWIGQNAEETFVYPDFYYQGIFFLREVIMRLGGVNASLHYMMDFELWRKYIALNGISRIRLSDEVLGLYRNHEQSKTNTSFNYFKHEILLIDLYVCQMFKFPSFYSNYICGKITSDNYYNPQKWYIGKDFKVRKVKLVILKKYLYQLYFDGEFKKCRKQLLQTMFNDLLIMDWKLFVLFVKLVILGKRLDNFFQRILKNFK